MNDQIIDALIEKLKALPPEQRAEVEGFVDFLSVRAKKRAALERLLAIAPALESASVPPVSMDEIHTEVKAVRAERRAQAQPAAGLNPENEAGGR
jgi:hypothetical protein